MRSRHKPPYNSFVTAEGDSLTEEMVKVLVYIADGKTFASEISRNTEYNIWSVFEILVALREMGFVKKQFGGNKRYIILTSEGERVVKEFQEVKE